MPEVTEKGSRKTEEEENGKGRVVVLYFLVDAKHVRK